ncbi:hypothetical protein SDJN02_16695, partial [Cucurbita argyrosperma subsp. argyrosperma]
MEALLILTSFTSIIVRVFLLGLVRFHINLERRTKCQNIFLEDAFKNLERKLERESLKKTISTSCRFELLQMVCGVPNGVDCEIPHRLEKGMKHS